MPHSPYHYYSFPFFFSSLFGYFSGLFICSFHLPRLSPGPLIYTAPTAPLGQTGLRRHSLCTLKGQCVHTDMKGWTKTENGFLRKHPETWDKWREKEKDTRRKENAQAPPSIFMSSKAEVPESCYLREWYDVALNNCTEVTLASALLERLRF